MKQHDNFCFRANSYTSHYYVIPTALSASLTVRAKTTIMVRTTHPAASGLTRGEEDTERGKNLDYRDPRTIIWRAISMDFS